MPVSNIPVCAVNKKLRTNMEHAAKTFLISFLTLNPQPAKKHAKISYPIIYKFMIENLTT
jgi:hypothetical protein